METKDLFDKILNEKFSNDEMLRRQKVEPLSLDEFTATRFIKEYPTLHEAAEKLLVHLELLHHKSATEELVEVVHEPSEKLKSPKTEYKVEVKAPHLYAVLINKIYGLNS